MLAILHDMDFAAEYFERVIAMAHGKILADGPKETVFYQEEALREAWIKQPHVTEFCGRLGLEGVFMTAADLVGGNEAGNETGSGGADGCEAESGGRGGNRAGSSDGSGSGADCGAAV